MSDAYETTYRNAVQAGATQAEEHAKWVTKRKHDEIAKARDALNLSAVESLGAEMVEQLRAGIAAREAILGLLYPATDEPKAADVEL